jgi:hypothetical protein
VDRKQIIAELDQGRAELRQDLRNLGRAIAVLRGSGRARFGFQLRRKRRKLSAATRKKMSEAQQKRWAAFKAEKANSRD